MKRLVLVGEDPASQVYVGARAKQTVEAGMHSFEHRLPAETGEAVLALVARLNAGVVGPMAVAGLLRNTVEAACARRGIAVPAM